MFIYRIIKEVIDTIEESKREEAQRKEEQARYANHQAMVKEFEKMLDEIEEHVFPKTGVGRYGASRSKTNDSANRIFRDYLRNARTLIEYNYKDTLGESDLCKYYELLSRYKVSNTRQEVDDRRALQERIHREEESRLQEENNRKRSLAVKFKYTTIGEFKAAYCFEYYPKNRYPFVLHEDELNRKSVWNFKDGHYSIGLMKVKEFIDGNFTSEQMRNLVLCVIPASTRYKNEVRYKVLCQKVSEALDITNGYNFITINFDRSDSRNHKSADTIGNLSFSNEVYGKDIVLFDDITTRGTSFVQIATELKRKGARSVYGFFLGKTIQ